MKQKVWILTREINDYNQEGEYFIACFIEKPTFEQLRKILYLTDETIEHILNGGGRRHSEDEWYNLTEIECGKIEG